PPPGWKYSYQWWCGSDDPETGRSYTTTADDGKARMTVLVRITATGPNGEKGSANVGYPDVWITKRGYDLSKTSVAGKGVVGAQLRVVGPLAPGLGATYQWTRNSEPIAGATGLTYTVSPADRGHILSVWVKAAARDGYRALNTHVGRVIVGTVRPIIRLSVHRGPIRAYRSATVFIHVWVPGDPLPYQTGVAGNVTITAGGKTYTRTLRARRDGEIITHLPELPPGEQKIKITFTPKSKDQCAKASATFTEEVITQ
ncbi:MAG: hypothetical protein FWD59_03675, partial [Micrococcales bacterium]|nr:hypothetical protein [Micrococcales bacterium]